MLEVLPHALHSALAQRLVLGLNHLLVREPAAQARLKPHAGKRVVLRLEGLPSWAPPAPPMAWWITPAGLLELAADEAEGAPALKIHLDLSQPAAVAARLALGERPDTQVSGETALATDMQWLLENLRWDARTDIESVFGPTAAGVAMSAADRGLGLARGALAPLLARLARGRQG